jgi:hypothetical protein
MTIARTRGFHAPHCLRVALWTLLFLGACAANSDSARPQKPAANAEHRPHAVAAPEHNAEPVDSPAVDTNAPVEADAGALRARENAPPSSASVVLLRAQCTRMTRRLCPPDHPCCNACSGVRWEPIQARALAGAEAAKLELKGAELPRCAWPAGTCHCAFDLHARGHMQNAAFVVESVEKLERAP